MILRRVEARNFMRFHRVELANLPERAVIAVGGPNESGKSTLAHLLVFALSGRPPRDAGAITDVIHWERRSAEAVLEFDAGGVRHVLRRVCDRDGRHEASLEAAGGPAVQGPEAVEARLRSLLGYQPRRAGRIFLADRQTLVSLAAAPPIEHLEKMVGLDHLDALGLRAEERAREGAARLEKDGRELARLQAELAATAWREDEGARAASRKAELDGAETALSRDLEEGRARAEGLRRQHAAVEQELKHFSEGVERLELHRLTAELPQRIARLEALDLPARPAEERARAVAILEGVLRYQQGCRDLAQRYEGRLNAIRGELGISHEGGTDRPDSVRALEEEGLRRLELGHWAVRCWTWTAGLLAGFSAAAFLAWGWHEPLAGVLRGIPGLPALAASGPGRELVAGLRSLHVHDRGLCPLEPAAWGLVALLLGLLAASAALAVRSRLAQTRRKRGHAALLARKARLQIEYDALLSADFKDMAEVAEAVRASGNRELVETLAGLKEGNPLFAEKGFDARAVLRIARGHLAEAASALALRLHQAGEAVRELEERIASGRNEIGKLAPQVQAQEERRRRHAELAGLAEGLRRDMAARERERAVGERLAGLAKGCHAAVVERLRFDLTGLFRRLLPEVTGRRYATIRLGTDFGLQVFSEERGDFVPLRQLSSGTHDLMLLVMHLMLVHGFCESRGVTRHFVFLDEPVPVVDAGRYARLAALLPILSPHVSQVFLCRPPEGVPGLCRIEATLERRELVADFAAAGR